MEEHNLNNTEIAQLFSVSRSTIDGINRCQNWTHLHNYTSNIRQENLNKAEKPHSSFAGENNPSSKIKEEQALEIVYLLETTNKSMASIARDLNISYDIVCDINRCRTWRYLHKYKKNIRKELKGE